MQIDELRYSIRARGGRARAVVAAAHLLAASACAGNATDPGRPGVSLVGTWRYAATGASAAQAQGALSFTQQRGAQVAGALDVLETAADGTQRRLAGPLAGQTSDSTTVDFEVQLGAAARRHVGRVRGDSLTGTWVETSVGGGAPTGSGSFRAARSP